MENKINIAELLKHCPKGMELDCVMFENVFFNAITDNKIFPISIKRIDGFPIVLTKYGEYANCPSSKCVIFPKGKTTWEGFVPPCEFKDGDIVATKNGLFIGIVKLKNNIQVKAYCAIDRYNSFEKDINYKFERFATKEEKAKLFKAIKDNGYKWNEESKSLEKLLRFKVGDKVKDENNCIVSIVRTNDGYYNYINEYGVGGIIYIKNQDDWELVQDKFDITTLKHFSKVLVRDSNAQKWIISFFSHCNNNQGKYKYFCINNTMFAQCIPYENNEHLFNTNTDCSEYYKTWG